MSKGYDLGDLFREAKPSSAERSKPEVIRETVFEPLPTPTVAGQAVQVCGKITKKATYELDAELLDRVNRFAKSRNMKKIGVIERALQEYLERNEG